MRVVARGGDESVVAVCAQRGAQCVRKEECAVRAAGSLRWQSGGHAYMRMVPGMQVCEMVWRERCPPKCVQCTTREEMSAKRGKKREVGTVNCVLILQRCNKESE